ncbi:hypothetical protein, partial [Planomonospora algeriensis]
MTAATVMTTSSSTLAAPWAPERCSAWPCPCGPCGLCCPCPAGPCPCPAALGLPPVRVERAGAGLAVPVRRGVRVLGRRGRADVRRPLERGVRLLERGVRLLERGVRRVRLLVGVRGRLLRLPARLRGRAGTAHVLRQVLRADPLGRDVPVGHRSRGTEQAGRAGPVRSRLTHMTRLTRPARSAVVRSTPPRPARLVTARGPAGGDVLLAEQPGGQVVRGRGVCGGDCAGDEGAVAWRSSSDVTRRVGHGSGWSGSSSEEYSPGRAAGGHGVDGAGPAGREDTGVGTSPGSAGRSEPVAKP